MITAIDKKTALVLIDLQKGIIKGDKAHPVENVLQKAADLVEAFHKANLPVVIVNVNPVGASWLVSRRDNTVLRNFGNTAAEIPDFTEISDLIKAQESDIFITKKTWNAFYNTALHEELQKHNVTGIVLGGISTSAGVEGTARAASERCYNISFATDAMTDANPLAHENSLLHIFPRLGELGTAADIIEKLKNL